MFLGLLRVSLGLLVVLNVSGFVVMFIGFFALFGSQHKVHRVLSFYINLGASLEVSIRRSNEMVRKW